jgi:hypothetical protein
MARSSRLVFLVIALALGILLAGAWRILREPAPPIQASTSPDDSSASPADSLARPAPSFPPASSPVTLQPPVPAPLAPSAPEPKVIWEERLEQLLDSDLDEKQLSQHILALWPFLPLTNQVEAAQYLADLTPDESYASLRPILTNPATDGEAVDELITDLLNRPEALQLPLFLDIAKTPGHPRQETARDYLELYVEEDYGQDWLQWEQAVQRYLKENPEL